MRGVCSCPGSRSAFAPPFRRNCEKFGLAFQGHMFSTESDFTCESAEPPMCGAHGVTIPQRYLKQKRASRFSAHSCCLPCDAFVHVASAFVDLCKCMPPPCARLPVPSINLPCLKPCCSSLPFRQLTCGCVLPRRLLFSVPSRACSRPCSRTGRIAAARLLHGACLTHTARPLTRDFRRSRAESEC